MEFAFEGTENTWENTEKMHFLQFPHTFPRVVKTQDCSSRDKLRQCHKVFEIAKLLVQEENYQDNEG